jgi:ABC-type multidrug transport system permease subunit
MSAILIFVRRSQKVSPSTTQLILCPLPQIENCSFDFSGCSANPAFEKPQNIMMAMVATVGDALNL